MAITVADLKFFQSERMTDEDDGGGQMTANEIVSGEDNQIFDDVSDVDRAVGDVSIRKVYAAITSVNTDKYLDASVVVFREPADPAASVLAFSTGDYYDERLDLRDYLETTIVRGGRWNGWLWGSHFEGQRALTLWQREENELPLIGQRVVLVKRNNNLETALQYVWITRITNALRTRFDEKGLYVVREVVCELAEALAVDFDGSEPSRVDPGIPDDLSLIYNTRYNAEAVSVYGIRPTVTLAETSDYSIQVDTLYAPIIPTGFTETPLADVNPGGDSPALIAGQTGTINFTTTTQCIKPDATLYCGTGITPSTLSISVSGATITDADGDALLAGQEIGAVDYSNGLIRWNGSCPNYSTLSKTVTFTPAARPLRVADTATQPVTIENRGYVWVITLAPIPAPQTLRVAYRVNNVWYVLNDLGSGLLRGVDSSYGSGTLSFSTGTVTITTGQLPDVDSEILYSWGTPVNYTSRGGDPVDAPVVRGQTEHHPLIPGTIEVTWTQVQNNYSLTDSNGALTGTGGAGEVDYFTGEWWVRPTDIPLVGTEFTIDYHYGEATPTTETFTGLTPDQNGDVTLTLQSGNLAEGSVYMTWFKPSNTRYWQHGPGLVTLRDDGDGHLVGQLLVDNGPDQVRFAISGQATVNYLNGTLLLPMEKTESYTFQIPDYHWELIGGEWRWVMSYQEHTATLTAEFFDADTILTVKYLSAGSTASASETVTLTQLQMDLTRGYGETIAAGSVRFRYGNSLYVDTAGQIYRDPSPATGAGTLSGSLDRSTGRVYLSQWTAGSSNAVTLESLITELAGQPVDFVAFRTPTAPIKSGTLQLRFTDIENNVYSKTVDGTGELEDGDCTISVDVLLGVVKARFGLWKVVADLTPEELLEPWYDPDTIVEIGGIEKIWKPLSVLADSILYNAVAQTFLPPDSDLLGINAARLPPNGQALIFSVGRMVLIHHTDTHTENSLSPTQTIDMGRVRLYRVIIEDADGQRLPATFYSVARDTGIVTMASDLNLTGYTGPYTFYHTVADLARLTQVDINGTLTLNKALSHDYPADDSRVSGVLYIGTLQARVTALFSQSTWTGDWQDTVIGDPPLAQYNDVLYPLIISNLGAYPDRFVFRFTSATAFACYGENLGYIGAGNINQNFAPTNALSGQPYFTVDYRGWGGGWSTGNCLRFNLIGANFPVDLIRAIQPSEPTGSDDSVELLFIGNVDA